jgi:hypothetical protein
MESGLTFFLIRRAHTMKMCALDALSEGQSAYSLCEGLETGRRDPGRCMCRSMRSVEDGQTAPSKPNLRRSAFLWIALVGASGRLVRRIGRRKKLIDTPVPSFALHRPVLPLPFISSFASGCP